mgnify:FL=1
MNLFINIILIIGMFWGLIGTTITSDTDTESAIPSSPIRVGIEYEDAASVRVAQDGIKEKLYTMLQNGQIVKPGENLLHHSDWRPWGSASLPAQHIFLKTIPGLEKAWLPNSAHGMLCGELTMATVLGIAPDQFLRDTYINISSLQGIYADATKGSSAAELRQIASYYGARTWTPSNRQRSTDCDGSWLQPGSNDMVRGELCTFYKQLQSGNIPVMTVGLNVETGMLESRGLFKDHPMAPRVVSHWIAVLEAVRAEDEFTYFRVFNPFQNREEWYAWDDIYRFHTEGMGGDQELFFVRTGK